MHNVTLASAASTAALTVGLAAYAALIFAGIAVRSTTHVGTAGAGRSPLR